MLFRPCSVFRTFTLALPAVCMQCTKWLLSVVPELRAFLMCCSGTVWVIFRWFQTPPIITGITFVSKFHIRCPSAVSSSYFKNILCSFLNHISASWICNFCDPTCPFFLITCYVIRFIIKDNSVRLYFWFHNIITLLQDSFLNGHTGVHFLFFTHISLHKLKVYLTHNLSCLFTYCSFASIEHKDVIFCNVSSNILFSLSLPSFKTNIKPIMNVNHTCLTFRRRIIFQILAHSVFKMWVIQKPNKVALWNKRHFEEKIM